MPVIPKFEMLGKRIKMSGSLDLTIHLVYALKKVYNTEQVYTWA